MKRKIIEKIGSGGFAEVFLAKDHQQKLVAVKILKHEFCDEPDIVTMFELEYKTSIALCHKNVVQTFSYDQEDGRPCIVLEYIDGYSLKKILSQLSLIPFESVIFIIHEILEALQAIHAQDVVHRSISPVDIMISLAGEVKVIDFLISKNFSNDFQTDVGVIKGKMGYMSPEQIRGEEIDKRSDLFCVGILFWEMLSQQRLFYDKNTMSILEKIKLCEVPDLGEAVPENLKKIVMKALAKDRDDRYQSASEFSNALKSNFLKLEDAKQLASLLAMISG